MKRILLAITLLWTVSLWAQPANLYCDSTVFDVSFSYTVDSTNTVQFINNTNPINDYSYEWKFEWGVYDSTVNPSYTYSTADVYYPELTAIDSVGSKCTYIDTISVNKCMLNMRFNANMGLFSLSYYGSGIKSISLDYGDGDTAKSFIRSSPYFIIYNQVNAHKYDSVGVFQAIATVVDTFNNVCRDTLLITKDCIADYDYTYDSTNTVYFTNQSQPIDSLSFLWEPEYMVTDTLRDLTYTYSSSGLEFPELTVTTTDNKICMTRDTVSINYCDLWWTMYGDTVDFSITTFTTELDSIYWNFGDGNSSSFFKKQLPSLLYEDRIRHSIKYAYSVDSTYQATVKAIDEFGNTCRDTVSFNYQPCYAGFTKSLDTLNNRVVLANYSSEHPNSNYTYDFGDGSPAITSTSKNISHSYSQYGTYEVCITVNNWRCTDTFCDSVGLDSLGNLKSSGFTVEFVDSNFVTSVEDLAQADAKLEGVTVYPNPSKNIFNVDLSKIDIQSEVLEMELYSTYGGLILKRRLNSPMEKVDLSNYADGLYFLRLSLGDKVAVEKLIKN